MPPFETGFYALLTGIPAFAGVSVWPVLLPEGSPLPAITFRIVGGRAQPTLTTRGPQRWRVQLDFHADLENGTYTQAASLRQAAILALDGWQGEMTNGPTITGTQFIQPIDYFDNDARQFRCGAEFYFTFNL